MENHRPHRIHVYANIWDILMVNVTIYSSTKDPMGSMIFFVCRQVFLFFSVANHGESRRQIIEKSCGNHGNSMEKNMGQKTWNKDGTPR